MDTIFNYQSVADEFGIPDSIVKKIEEEMIMMFLFRNLY